MKTGLNLTELAKELDRQKETKRDFIAPTTELKMTTVENKVKGMSTPIGVELKVNGHGTFGIRETAHQQIAQRVGVPQKYYDRMKAEAPDLLAQNVNHWFQAQPEKRMVRTLDGYDRGFLSSRYRPLDNQDLAEVALSTLLKEKDLRVESCALTETRMYIKAVTARLTAEVKVGDVVQSGIVITNSEIGLGSVKVEPMIYRLICSNGAISNDLAMKKYHVGRDWDSELAEELLQDETRKQDDRAFWMKVRDVIAGSFRQDVFDRLVNRMREATRTSDIKKPSKAIEVITAKFGLQEAEGEGVLAHLIKGGDLSQYGLMNAVTRLSQDVESYDRATELERLGGTVLELPKTDWAELAEVA